MKRIATILLSVISYAAMGQVYPSDAKPATNYGMIWQAVDTLIIGSDTTFLFDWVDAPIAANIATLADINVYANSNASTVNNEITVTNNIGLDGSNVAGNSNTYRLRNDNPLYFDGTIPITLDVDGEVTYIEKRPGFGINSTRGAEVTGEHYWTDEIDTSEIATQYDLTQINVDDADADPTNELDSITINGTLLTNGSSLTIDSGVWSENGSNIYYNSGNVGIGTNVPAANLDVEGDFATIRITDDVSRTPRLDLIRGSGTYGSDVYGDWRIDNTGAVLSFKNKSTTVDRTFLTLDGTSSSAVGPLVGINVTNPTSRLHIDGEITSKVNSATSSQWLTFYDDNSAVTDGSFLGGIRAYETDGGAAQTGAMYWKYNGTAGSSDLVLESTASIELDAPTIGSGLIYSNAGVLANATIGTGLSFSGGVLSSTVSSPWTVSGSNIYRTTGNVGIGTASPTYKLHINGNANVDGNFEILDARSSTVLNNTGMGGFYNFYGGVNAGSTNTGSNYNVAIGSNSLNNVAGGDANMVFGHLAAASLTTGSSNVCIGNQSGFSNETGSGNICIGVSAGYFNTTSHRLFISGLGYHTVPLIYGEFDNQILAIRGDLGVKNLTPANDLDVEGGIRQADATNAILYADADGDILGATTGAGISYSSGTIDNRTSAGRGNLTTTTLTTTSMQSIGIATVDYNINDVTVNTTLERFIIGSDGYYQFHWNGLIEWATQTQVEIQIEVNGVDQTDYLHLINLDDKDEARFSWSDIIPLSSGDYITLQGRKFSGAVGDPDISGWFTIARL